MNDDLVGVVADTMPPTSHCGYDAIRLHSASGQASRHTRDHVDGYVPGGRSENVTVSS